MLSFMWLRFFPFPITLLPLFLFSCNIFQGKRQMAKLLMQGFQTPMGFLFGLWIRPLRSDSNIQPLEALIHIWCQEEDKPLFLSSADQTTPAMFFPV